MSKVATAVAIVGIAVALGPAGFGVLSATTFITASAALNASISLLASTVLAQLTAKRLKPSGIQREATTSGSVEPQSFIVGYSATAGHSVWPESTHGKAGKTPNAFLTYVIDLGDLPAGPLDGLIVDGEFVEIDWNMPIGPDDGHPVLGRLAGFMWVRYHDGTQTTADSFLMAQYGSDPDVPWTADMVLTGVPHMILVFKFDRERFKGFPAVKAVGASIPLYDPRADSSVGGSGAMRWDDPSTWVPRRNLALQIYNIRRGIPLPDGDFWGGGHSADDLPLDVWINAINACDALVPDTGGVMRPQYHGGFEIRLSDEPADIEAELLKGCSGRIADVGGQIIIQVGAPSLPVLFFADDDILATADVQDMPLPAPGDIWNGVEATFPQPSALWAARPSPPLFDEVLRAEDGGQRKVATVSLPAVPFPGQVQRLQQSWLKDSRRFRRHILTLGSQAHALEPFDTVGWTSPKRGYVQKLFEVAVIEFSPLSANNRLTLRERDPADFIVPTTLLDEPPVGIINRPVPDQGVPSYTFTADSVTDASGTSRRPDLRHSWDPTDLEDVTGVLLEVRVASTGAALPSKTTSDVASGEARVGAANLIPGTTYEGRATLIAAGRRTVPSAWKSAVAPVLMITSSDLGASSVTNTQIADVAAAKITGQLLNAQVASLAASKVTGQLTDVQIAALAAAKITGQITGTQIADGTINTAKFAGTIKPVEILAALPTTGHVAGRVVYLTTDSKLYRNTGAGWIATVPSADITGQLTDAQIAALAAAKITGQVTGTQITNGAISTPKLAAGAVTANEIAASAVTAAKIAAGAITAGKISAGAIVAADIAADTITAGQIAVGAIGASEIAANAVTAAKIAAGSVTTANLVAGAVTANEIAAGAVTTAKLVAGAVTANEIAANAVTAAKIAAGSVTTAKLVAGAVTANEVAAASIITAKINGRAVTTLERVFTGTSFTVTSSTGFGLNQNFVIPSDDTNIRITVQYAMGAVTTPFLLVQEVRVDGALLSSVGLANVQEVVLWQDFKLIPTAKTILVDVGFTLIGAGSVAMNGLSFTVEQFKR